MELRKSVREGGELEGKEEKEKRKKEVGGGGERRWRVRPGRKRRKKRSWNGGRVRRKGEEIK